MALLGIDVGSSACKSVVFDESGRVLSQFLQEYGSDTPPEGMEAEALWRAVLESVRRAVADSSDKRISALGVSSFGESFVPIDAKGTALAPVMSYIDSRGREEFDGLVRAMDPDRIMEISGVKPHPMYSLSRMAYLRDRKPQAFASTWKYLPIASFILYRLCGAAVTDFSLAARTLAFDVVHKRWNGELLALAGVHTAQMPDAVPSGTVVGGLDKGIARLAGIEGDTAVVTGGHDQVCAAFGAGVIAKGDAVDGTGSVECITPAFDAPVMSHGFLLSNYACVPHVLHGLYVTYAFNFTGGSLLKWYRDAFALGLADEARRTGRSVYALLDEKAGTEPSEMTVVPHFAGSGTPDMDPSAKGALFGLDFSADMGSVYRALMEGVTFEMRYNLERLRDFGVDIRNLRAVGGGSKSPLWLGMKASIWGRPVHALETEEAGAAGAAMLAGLATGIYRSPAEAVEAFVRIRRTYEPEPALQAGYEASYGRFLEARKTIEGMKR